MISVCKDLESIFGNQSTQMREVCYAIYAMPEVEKIVLYGSFAKRCAGCESDVDLAVFLNSTDARLLRFYRKLARICVNPEIDIQVQPFHSFELATPCGIIEEIDAYGLELRP